MKGEKDVEDRLLSFDNSIGGKKYYVILQYKSKF
jgi:hypothetical protein